MLLTPSEATTNPTIADVLGVPGAIPDYTRPTGLYNGLRWSCGQTLNYLAYQRRKDSDTFSTSLCSGVDLSEADYGKVYPTLISTDPTSVLFTPLNEPLTPFYNPSRQHAYFSVSTASSASSSDVNSNNGKRNGSTTTATTAQPSPLKVDGITECDQGSSLLRGRF